MQSFHRLFVILLAALSASCTGTATRSETDAASPSAQFNVLGREDAPVSIIEFTDLQCPYCAQFAIDTFPSIRRNYIDTGKVRLAARDLPLPVHSFAIPAAVAARCAGEQGKFWEFREALFMAQHRLGTEPYDELARRLGLDLAKFDGCRRHGQQEAYVRADLELAKAYGISGTPTFVIGRIVDGVFEGETISGAKPYEVFAAKIDLLLGAGN